MVWFKKKTIMVWDKISMLRQLSYVRNLVIPECVFSEQWVFLLVAEMGFYFSGTFFGRLGFRSDGRSEQ